MIKRKCKLIQTICSFGKNKVLPILLVVKNVGCKVFKFCLKIIRLLFLLSVFSVFTVVPFLHNQMNHFLAQCLWHPACAIFMIASIKGLKKTRQYFGTRFVKDNFTVPIIFVENLVSEGQTVISALRARICILQVLAPNDV